MEESRPVGRPRVHNRPAIEEALWRYIADTPVPILAEFAAQQHLWVQRLYEWPELEEPIKVLCAKKEGALERGALNDNLVASMAIFSLKQMGWSDKQDIKHSGEIPTKATVELVDGRRPDNPPAVP